MNPNSDAAVLAAIGALVYGQTHGSAQPEDRAKAAIVIAKALILAAAATLPPPVERDAGLYKQEPDPG